MPARPDVTERRFPVMGSHGHVVVVGGPADLAARAEARLQQLEARWSRFRPASELSRLNRSHGAACVVSADTVVLVDALRQAWERTGGRFDATVHDAMGAWGYGTSWPFPAPVRLPATPAPAPGSAGIEARPERGLVRLPEGVRLDPGGLGKGLAADLVAAELMAGGAEGVLVNVGGDLRATGASPDPDGGPWRVAIEHPDRPDDDVAMVELHDGAVATSTSRRRRWTDADGGGAHHLLDPATGRPADRPWTQVSVVTGSAWWAEVLTKVVFLDGELPADDTATGRAAALVLLTDGTHRVLGPAWFHATAGAAR